MTRDKIMIICIFIIILLLISWNRFYVYKKRSDQYRDEMLLKEQKMLPNIINATNTPNDDTNNYFGDQKSIKKKNTFELNKDKLYIYDNLPHDESGIDISQLFAVQNLYGKKRKVILY